MYVPQVLSSRQYWKDILERLNFYMVHLVRVA
jgi:hypothetical protein